MIDPAPRFQVLAHDNQTQLVQAAERREVRGREGSVRHVEVFLDGGVRTSILGRPRPLPRHRRADRSSRWLATNYTLNWEEPPMGVHSLTPTLDGAAGMISVAICDDDPGVRDLLPTVLASDPKLNIVGIFATGQEALTFDGHVDVWLMDVRLPGTSGHEVCRQLLARASPPRVLMLTASPDGPVAETLTTGAAGYLYKDDRPDNLIAAIRGVAAGYSLSSPAAVSTLLRGDEKLVRSVAALVEDDVDRALLSLILEGHSIRELAKRVHLSESGVKKRLKRYMEALDVSSRPMLMAKLHAAGPAARAGRLDPAR